jgi:FixJ family two-component response regulator
MSTLRPLRIFVVDDEPVIAETVVEILGLSGFSASSFSNPFDVLIRARSDAPDLLISDVMMPKLSGIELSIQMKSLCPNCVILLFSGCANVGLMLGSAQARGYDFNLLQKPVHPKDLLDRIRTIEAEHFLHAHPSTILEGAAD